MTSSMLAGERRWASARRGGMTVLGKVAVPKPLNLPSQKLENHGLDPNVEIVPKGGLSWGNRPSSSTSNPWGSSAISPKAGGTTGSPGHPCGHPSSGEGLSRPSTGGSDRTHEPAATAWVPNSRPSSASGVLTSNQSSLTPRPHSAEMRPGSSHLSRFAEPVSDNSMAWGPNGTAEKLPMPYKNSDFSLSSGDFPTLGSEKDNAGKSSESHDHGSDVRPSSASGRTAPANERNAISQADVKNGTMNTWTRDGPLHVEDGVRSSAEKWQGAQQQYVNPNVHHQHFDAWRGPPMNAPAGVWYRGPPGGPPYPPVAHGGFPVEPFPYYHPQIPPALANSQTCPPAGVGPRGHPKNGDFYRPHMPDPFIRPGMPIGPGFYPGPAPYDGYYGPPMGYNPNEQNIPFMGMPPGPPVYNMYPAQNPSEPSDAHFRAGGRESTGNMLVPEQLDSVRPEESRGPYKVRRKHENEWDAGAEENWEPTIVANSLSLEKVDQPRPSSRKNERGANDRKNEDVPSRRNEDVPSRRNEDVPSRRNTSADNPSSRNFGNRGNPLDSVIVHSREGMHNSKALDDCWAKKSETGASCFPEVPHGPPAEAKDSCLIQKIEDLDPKVRASDVRKDAASGFLRDEQKNRLLANSKAYGSTVEVGSTYTGGDLAPSHDMGVPTGDNTIKSTIASAPQFSRRSHYGVQNRADHLSKGRLNNQDACQWQKNPPILGSESAAAVSNQNVCHTTTSQVPDHHISMEAVENSEIKDAGESSTPMFNSTDGQAQHAKMRELAKQRAIQLQEEEEERIREQKAKALAKLEDLNRRTLAADGTTQNVEKTLISVTVPQDVHGSQALPEPVIAASKYEALGSDLSAKPQAIAQTRESSTSGAGQSTALLRGSHLETLKNDQQEPIVLHSQLLPSKQNVANATGDESKAAPLVNDGSLPRQKRVAYKQKQSVQVGKSLAYKSTLTGSSDTPKGQAGAVIQNSGTDVAVSGAAVPSIESSLQNNLNILPESTTHQRKKNNRSSKSKHMLDDASTTATASSSSVSRETNLGKVSTESGKPKSPEFKLDASTVLVIDSKDAVQPNLEHNSLPSKAAHGRANNQYKPQRSHGVPRNPQANTSVDRFHGGDAVMWAPMWAQNNAEPGEEAGQRTVQDVVPPPPKNSNSVQTNLKSKRAEMERYVPKPVAKELAQQGSMQQPEALSSPGKSTLEEMTQREVLGSQSAIPASGNVGSAVESKGGDSKHNKHGAWRQRGPNELYREQDLQQGSSSTPNSSKNYEKSMRQHEASNPIPTVTNIIHEWDPSDGWHMPECPPTEVSTATSVVKDHGGITGKEKRQTYKGQRSSVNNHDVYHKNVSSADGDNLMQSTTSLEINQTNRPVSSKEHRASHWQPKSQSHRGDMSSGAQNASSKLKRDSPPRVQPEESVAEYKNARESPHAEHQESRRGRRSASFKGRPHSPNQGFGNMEDDAPSEQLHVSSGFRKNGGQSNRSAGQDNRQRQSSHYKYQPVGSNNYNSNTSKFNNFDAPTEGSQSTAPRYRERGSGQSRRGGGNFHG